MSFLASLTIECIDDFTFAKEATRKSRLQCTDLLRVAMLSAIVPLKATRSPANLLSIIENGKVLIIPT